MNFTIIRHIFDLRHLMIQKFYQNFYQTNLKNELKKGFIFFEKSQNKVIFHQIIKYLKFGAFFLCLFLRNFHSE